VEAIILVGGFGIRLRPLTLATPKALLPLANVPMLERLVRSLPKRVTKVALAVHHQADAITAHFAAIDCGCEVITVPETEPLGTGGAMRNCREHITGTALVFNGDIVSSLDIEAMLAQHRATGALGTLALWEVDDPSRYGVADLDGNAIVGFQEKPAAGEEKSRLINAGTYLLEPKVFEMIPAGRKVSVEREIFTQLAGAGLHGFPFAGSWIDAGTPESYLAANAMLLEREATAAHPGASVRGNALIAADAEITSSIVGPDTVIGPGVSLDKCVVRRSVLLAGASATGAVIEDCILGPSVVVDSDRSRMVLAAEGELQF
jgi:mannose-1-phosphate guanylyltransferase